jgi:dihydropyrimidinase
VAGAKDEGLKVFAETCPHYLLLDDELFKREDGHLYATCPQLKKRSDQARLWEGLKRGEISVLSTDTCTFTKEQKGMWEGDFTRIPYGLPGVETLLPLMFTYGVEKGKISLEKLVKLLSLNPAKLMGLYPQKGGLWVGADADIVILDPKARMKISHNNLRTNCDWSPYEGFETVGMPVFTILRGEIIAEKGEFRGKVGGGRFLHRSNPIFEL